MRANTPSPERSPSPPEQKLRPEITRRLPDSGYSSADSTKNSREALKREVNGFKLMGRATISSPSMAQLYNRGIPDARLLKAVKVVNKARMLQKLLLRKELRKDLLGFHGIVTITGGTPSSTDGFSKSRALR